MADVDATIAALDALMERVDDATGQIVADGLHLIQAASMGFAPVGVTGNSTNAPGDLRRSIIVEGPARVGDHQWTGRVGPTVIYGRQRELGGAIYPQTARSLVFTKFGTTYYRQRVYQHPQPYMKPGADAAIPNIAAVRDARLSEAIQA